MPKYFLYVRKSTDVEDKQVRSIEDQLAVLRALAKQDGLHISEVFIEKMSAKKTGRPIYGDMMSRIEKGEAQGIICWKLDRLARNMDDGGKIIEWLLQRVIQHIRTFERSYYPTDNVLLMCIEFGIANQFSIDLGTNTKRGLDEKVKRGEWPSLAPIGYMNDKRIKRVVVNRKQAKIVKAAFELYAEGNSRLEDISSFFAKHGIFANTGKVIARDRVAYILANPFYYGVFKYAGELHEGKHETIISKKLFDRVQVALKDRGKPHHKPKNEPQPLCGLFRCGECGRSITAEDKYKRQVSGKVHHYIYYRCTKKNIVCSQPHIRDGELVSQLSDALQEFALPTDWAAELSRLADEDAKTDAHESTAASQAMKDEVATIEARLERLLTAYLDQDIDREAYLQEKLELLSRKKSLGEKIADLKRGSIAWLEPMREWIKDSVIVGESSLSPSLYDKKSSALKISGSNPLLKNRRIVFNPIPPSDALRASRKNFGKEDYVFCLSRCPGLNRRPRSYQERALPTELHRRQTDTSTRPHTPTIHAASFCGSELSLAGSSESVFKKYWSAGFPEATDRGLCGDSTLAVNRRKCSSLRRPFANARSFKATARCDR
jgi:site-specific DNA recombinase